MLSCDNTPPAYLSVPVNPVIVVISAFLVFSIFNIFPAVILLPRAKTNFSVESPTNKTGEEIEPSVWLLFTTQFKPEPDCIIVPDSSKQQKKYLYSLLESKGITKSILYKKSTTFFKG